MSTLAYVPCKCGCRPPDAPEPCGCPECRPGPGLNHQAERAASARLRETRMMLLLHRTTLTDQESFELDGLLDWYIRRS